MLLIAIEKLPTKRRKSFLFFTKLSYGVGCIVLKLTFFISKKYKSTDHLVDKITFVRAARLFFGPLLCYEMYKSARELQVGAQSVTVHRSVRIS